MPTLFVVSGFASRIMSHREVLISLAGLCLVLLTLLLGRVNSAVILLTGTSESWSFPDMEASFGTCFRFSHHAFRSLTHGFANLCCKINCVVLVGFQLVIHLVTEPFLLSKQGGWPIYSAIFRVFLNFCEQSFVNLLSLDWQLHVFRLLVSWECCMHPTLWMLVRRWSTFQAQDKLSCRLSFWLNAGSAILRWRCAMPRTLDSRQLSSTTTRMIMS